MFKRKREKEINRKGSIRDAIVAHCSKLENSHKSIWFVYLATAIQIVKILYICLWVGFCTDYVYVYIFNAQERQLGASSNLRAFFSSMSRKQLALQTYRKFTEAVGHSQKRKKKKKKYQPHSDYLCKLTGDLPHHHNFCGRQHPSCWEIWESVENINFQSLFWLYRNGIGNKIYLTSFQMFFTRLIHLIMFCL